MRANLVMTRGTERVFSLNLEDAEGGLPTLAGASADLIVDGQLRKTATIDESAGEANVTLDPDDTGSGQRVSVPYNVRVTEADGSVLVTQRGLFTLLPDVSDPSEAT